MQQGISQETQKALNGVNANFDEIFSVMSAEEFLTQNNVSPKKIAELKQIAQTHGLTLEDVTRRSMLVFTTALEETAQGAFTLELVSAKRDETIEILLRDPPSPSVWQRLKLFFAKLAQDSWMNPWMRRAS